MSYLIGYLNSPMLIISSLPYTTKILCDYLLPASKYSIIQIGNGISWVYNGLHNKGMDSYETDFDDLNDAPSLQESASNAITRIKESINVIENKEKYLEDRIKILMQEAYDKHIRNNRKGALFALKRKKLYEKESNTLSDIKMNLEMKCMNLETMIINLEVYSTLRLAAYQMKNINNEMDIDKIDMTLDDIQEGLSLTDEINSILSQPISGNEIYDDCELLEELNDYIPNNNITHDALRCKQEDNLIDLPYPPDSILQMEEELIDDNYLKILEYD